MVAAHLPAVQRGCPTPPSSDGGRTAHDFPHAFLILLHPSPAASCKDTELCHRPGTPGCHASREAQLNSGDSLPGAPCHREAWRGDAHTRLGKEGQAPCLQRCPQWDESPPLTRKDADQLHLVGSRTRSQSPAPLPARRPGGGGSRAEAVPTPVLLCFALELRDQTPPSPCCVPSSPLR